MREHVNKSICISWSIFNTMRTGNKKWQWILKKLMRTGNGFYKTSITLQAKQEILFEVTRTWVSLKLDVCNVCVRFATQLRPKWLNHIIKYFAKPNGTFTIFVDWWHNRFIVHQLQTVSLFSNWDSKLPKHIPSSSSSSSSITSPSSQTQAQ